MGADAQPVKDFFINMITRDISLQDCIMDLLDNCLDGACRQAGSGLCSPDAYKGYRATITFNETEFAIDDNCGGISIVDAEKYAFNFGRNPDAPAESQYSIGIYGIGMKRAMFKIGKAINVESSTASESFVVKIDVEEWRTRPGPWTFDMEKSGTCVGKKGTKITINNLNQGIAEEFRDTKFVGSLRDAIARDYSFFLQQGFCVEVNGVTVKPYEFRLRMSEDFVPASIEYKEEEEGVRVTIQMGLAELPSEEDQPESDHTEMAYYGWFVACNRRIVLAADRTDRTVWGHEAVASWHPQYNGFMGIVFFDSPDPRKLPWTTTKRGLDQSAPLYRRAVIRMEELTRQFTRYTNKRKEDQAAARLLEEKTEAKALHELPKSETFKTPVVAKPTIPMANILYRKPKTEVTRVAEALGNRYMFYNEVGIKTFEFYLENMVSDQ